MTPVYDFAVAGAGPAGSRAAELLARRGAAVMLFDPKAPWEKPCGGGLTAAALRHTPELHELAPRGRAVTEAVVEAPNGRRIVLPLGNPYLVVSRLELSRWGVARAQAAGVRFTNLAIRSVEQEGTAWRVEDSRGMVHRARWLLGADGAASRLRTLLAPGFHPNLEPTRVAYPPRRVSQNRATFRFLDGAGYLWNFPRRDHASLGIVVPARTAVRKDLDSEILEYDSLNATPDEPLEIRGAVIPTFDSRPTSFTLIGRRTWALLGDAAGLVEPALREGIDYAFRSAAIAVDAFREDCGFERYPARLEEALGPELRRARRIRRVLHVTGLVNLVVGWALRSFRMNQLVVAVGNAVNEHESLRRAAWEALRKPLPAARYPLSA